jgi:flagellin-like hook-associated protein FlgL
MSVAFHNHISAINAYCFDDSSVSSSRIQHVDVAEETSCFTTALILRQVGISILAQANASHQKILSLLSGR